MSSSEDEEGGRIAFSTEGDYEDGQWVGGEFYARGQRKGRHMSKEEALYGYEGSDDDNGGGYQGGGRKKGRRDIGGPIRPIDFVSGKPKPGNQRPKEEEEAEEEDGEEEEPWNAPSRGGLGFTGGEGSSGEEEEEGRPGLGLGAARAGLGSNRKKIRKAKRKEENDMEVDEEGGGEKDVRESKEKFKDLLKEGGVSLQGSHDGKSQDSFRGMLKDAEDKAAEVQAKEEAKKALKALPVRSDPGSMGWENHTKGFASKYLAKFGFKGRLGKDETGITKVPEVVVRPDRLGLGIMKEATQLRSNREIEADLHGKEMEEASDDENKRGRRKKKDKGKLSVAEQMAADAENWKKGGAAGAGKKGAKAKHKRLTVKDVLSMEQDADFVHEGEKKTVIKDLRGPQEKLLTRLDEINYELEAGPTSEGEPPKLGQELLHNINLLVDLCESGLYGLDRRIKHDEKQLENLMTQILDLERRVGEGEEKSNRLDKVSTLITRVQDKINETHGDVPLDAILKVFRTLKEHFWEEYIMFELWDLAPTLLSPVLIRFLANWDPLTQSEIIIDFLLKWIPVLGGRREGRGAGGQAGGDNPLLAKAGEAVCHDLTRRMILPKIRSALVNQWEVRNVEPAVHLMERLRTVMQVDDWGGLCTTVIMPKLSQAVNEWNPREDIVPIHQWIHPWLPILGVQLSAVFPEIRRKLSQVLTEWHPSDGSAHIILAPWVQVFDLRSYETLLLRSIVPKLVEALRNFPIVPHNQDLQPLEWVFTWADLLSPLHFLALLEGELFPKWLQVLYTWLQAPTADLSEIADWFEGWKNLFPPQVQADPRIAAHFDHALQAMNQAMDPDSPPLAPLSLDQISYVSVVEDRRQEALHAAAAGLPPPPSSSSSNTTYVGGSFGGGGTNSSSRISVPTNIPPVNVSFKELVERFAEKNGVLLVPKPGKTYSGRQVYSFGGVSIYLDHDVVFADLGSSSRGGGAAAGGGRQQGYAPIALDSLLQHVQGR